MGKIINKKKPLCTTGEKENKKSEKNIKYIFPGLKPMLWNSDPWNNRKVATV